MQINGSNGATGSDKPANERDVFIVSAVRTPIGSMGGSLAAVKAPGLAAAAIKAALERANQLSPEHVEKVTLGQAVQAGSGQAAAKQALMAAGLPSTCRDCLVNEVCASGMQAIILSALQIKHLGANCLVAGGMESMSNAPYYQTRKPPIFGGHKIEDGLLVDGLTDSFNSCHMGDCAEQTAKKYSIGREAQDAYAIESYRRAQVAHDSGQLAREICAVQVPSSRRGKPPVEVVDDEEFRKIDVAKVGQLSACFDKQSGTITAANASSLSDGAAVCLLMSSEALERHQLKPLAKIVAFGEGACDPVDFATSPVAAIRQALERAQLKIEQVALWEINEAFSVVALANMKDLGLDPEKVNVNGGGVSLGHPLGMSGARIVNVLVHQLKAGEFGCAAICRGGGGSAAIIIQKL